MTSFFTRATKHLQHEAAGSTGIGVHQERFGSYVYNRLEDLAKDNNNQLNSPSPHFSDALAQLIEKTLDAKNVHYELTLTSEDYQAFFEGYLVEKIEAGSEIDLLDGGEAKEQVLLNSTAEQYLAKKHEEIKQQKLAKKYKSLEAKFDNLFSALDNVLFREPMDREPDWLREQGLPKNMQIAANLSRAQKANIELKQRASSFIYAIFLMAKTKLGSIITLAGNDQLEQLQEKLFQSYGPFAEDVDAAGEGLADDEFYEDFLKRELEQTFIPQLTNLVENEFGLSHKEAGTALHHYECFANWERQRNDKGFAVVTKLDKEEGYMVQVSKPLETPLTDAQKQELESITEVKKPLWFTVLPNLTQTFLVENLERIISGELACPPSVLRFIPTLANVREDLTYLTNSKGQVQFHTSAIRGAVPTAVGVKDESERELLTQQNVAQLDDVMGDLQAHFDNFWGDDHSSKLQYVKLFALGARYLSPGWFDRFPLIKRLVGSDNNHRMNKEYRDANADFGMRKHIIDTVIPVNAARAQADDLFTDANNLRAREALGGLAKNILNQFLPDLGFTPEAQEKLKGALSQRRMLTSDDLATINFELDTRVRSLFSGDTVKQNRFKVAMRALQVYQQIWEDYEANGKIDNPHDLNIELILAACQSLIAEGFGLKVFHGCKSAKDRLAAVEMQKAALAQFLLKENREFNPQCEDHVKELSGYFADAHASHYNQHVVSKYSSYGIHALQDGRGFTPKSYAQMIPTPYVRAIGKKALEAEAHEDQVGFIDEGCLERGKQVIARESKLGKTASLGKLKQGAKKAWAAVTSFFSGLFGSNSPVENPSPIALVVKADAETGMTVPDTTAEAAKEVVTLNYPKACAMTVSAVDEVEVVQSTDIRNSTFSPSTVAQGVFAERDDRRMKRSPSNEDVRAALATPPEEVSIEIDYDLFLQVLLSNGSDIAEIEASLPQFPVHQEGMRQAIDTYHTDTCRNELSRLPTGTPAPVSAM